MNDESSAMEETASPTAEATTADDSCIAQFIEIVPLSIRRNELDIFAVREVKEEDLVNCEFSADIKQEPEDECRAQISSDVSVRLSAHVILERSCIKQGSCAGLEFKANLEKSLNFRKLKKALLNCFGKRMEGLVKFGICLL